MIRNQLLQSCSVLQSISTALATTRRMSIGERVGDLHITPAAKYLFRTPQLPAFSVHRRRHFSSTLTPVRDHVVGMDTSADGCCRRGGERLVAVIIGLV